MVTTLPAKYREALMLSASGDHTFDEIGRLLGIPTGTAKWRAMEGRRILKKKLTSRGFGRAARRAARNWELELELRLGTRDGVAEQAMTGSLGPDDSRLDGGDDRVIDDALRAACRKAPAICAKCSHGSKPVEGASMVHPARPAMLPVAGAVLIVIGVASVGQWMAAERGGPRTGGATGIDQPQAASTLAHKVGLASRAVPGDALTSPSPAEAARRRPSRDNRVFAASLFEMDAEPREGTQPTRCPPTRRSQAVLPAQSAEPRRPDHADSQASPGRYSAHRHDAHRHGAHRGCAAGFHAGHAGQHAIARPQFPGSDRSRQDRRSPSMKHRLALALAFAFVIFCKAR
jgi:hypothetical protein